MDEFIISRFDGVIDDLEIIYRYTVGIVKVFISKDGQYIAREPPISTHAEKIYGTLMHSLRQSIELKAFSKSDILKNITTQLELESKKSGAFDVWINERESIEYYLKRNLTGYSEIDVLINDVYIEDILSVRYDKPITIIHNKLQNFSSLYTNIFFKSEEQMSKLIQRISKKYGDPLLM